MPAMVARFAHLESAEVAGFVNLLENRTKQGESSLMDLGEILLGICLLAASIAGLWIALPREGVVVGFLRSDAVQSYYSVVLLSLMALGLVYIIKGVVP